jgi:hypothetical protein
MVISPSVFFTRQLWLLPGWLPSLLPKSLAVILSFPSDDFALPRKRVHVAKYVAISVLEIRRRACCLLSIFQKFLCFVVAVAETMDSFSNLDSKSGAP